MTSPRRLALAAGALLSALVLAAPASAAAPGINVSGYGDAQAALDLGAQQVRFFVRWSDFEPGGPADYRAGSGAVTPNVFTTGLSDNVRRVHAAGATPILVVLDAPAWAATSGHPRSATEYAAFAGELAGNLRPLRGGRGTIAYEVWNEPDAPEFWGGPPDAAFYTRMLQASHAAIKTADPGATVLTGPTTGNNDAWIEALYAHGAKGSFDGVSVHTDTACSDASPDQFYRDPDGALGRYTFLGYREVHRTMVAHGDAKPIWMSELGWSTTNGGPTSCTRGASAGRKPSGVDEATQARFLAQAFRCMARDPYVVAATWFTFRDAAGQPQSAEVANYGLMRRDGSAKPSRAAFRAAAAEGPGACGDFEEPALDVSSPQEGQKYADRLDLRAAASDTGVGLARLSYTYDGGRRIGSFADELANGRSFGLSPWYGSRALPLGPHTIEVTARDRNGNVATRAVHVEKVVPGAIAATLAPSFRMPKRVTCRRGVCTFKGSLRRVTGGGSPGGRVAVEWRWKNKKGSWRRLMGGLSSASKPFAFRAKLGRKGVWRVRVVYRGVAPYKSVSSKYLSVRIG